MRDAAARRASTDRGITRTQDSGFLGARDAGQSYRGSVTSQPPPRPAVRVTSPRLVAGATAQLAALGLVGPVLIVILATFLGLGVGLILVLGIGLLLPPRVRLHALRGRLARPGAPRGAVRVRHPAAEPAAADTGFGGFLRTVWM